MPGLIRRALKGNASFWGLVEYGVGPLTALAAVPLLFGQLGTVGYGQFAMVLALAGFGNVANLGAAITATKLVSERVHEEGGAVRGASVSVALVSLALGVVAIGAVIAWLAILLFWPHVTFGGLPIAALALPALAVYLGQQVDQLFSGCLKGSEHFSATALCEGGGRIAALAISVTVAFMTKSPALTALAQAAGLLCTGLLKMHLFARQHGRSVILPHYDKPAMGTAFRFSRWSWLNSLSALAFGSVDRVLVGSLLGPAVLAIYTVGAQVGQIIHTVCVALFQKAMPRVSRLLSQSKEGVAPGREIRKMVLVNFALSAIGTVLGLAFAGPLLRMLAGEDATAHLHTFQLLIVASGLLSLNVASHFSLLGLGNARVVALLNGGAGLVMIGVLVFGVPLMGEPAAGWARILYALVTLLGIWVAFRETRPMASPIVSPGLR
ncbi:oligosaccharide flippase family protein [Schauerella aestuarii]|uniref:oligosaccharide flippase family protein n=1 Tax=Schauerella aestuarii TaxID=2511204 RepID=UPI00136B0108|nr:oligosaccharide flippase family protein [Achromobacter aestuarii]MYZ45743.1 polysaccharide biosynthesis family protein [Achromobacter aestuarii]